jgi:GAF domain-containing protein
VFTRGPAHVVEFLSPAACELTGTGSTGQVQGRPVADAIPEALAGGLVELLDRAFITGHSFRDVEQRLVDRRGDVAVERWFDLGCQPVREPDGGVSGLVLYGVEVTGKVRARRRVEFLAQVSAVLLESAGAADVLERAAALVVPAHGEVVLVDLTQQDGILRAAMAVHGDPVLDEVLRSSPPAPTRIAYRVLETGRTEAVPGGSGWGEVPTGLKLRCLLVVALVARGQILGTFSVGRTTRPGFADDEVTLIEGLAARAALVVHTAQLHQAQRIAGEAAEQAQARNAALHQLAAALSQAPTVAEIGLACGCQKRRTRLTAGRAVVFATVSACWRKDSDDPRPLCRASPASDVQRDQHRRRRRGNAAEGPGQWHPGGRW